MSTSDSGTHRPGGAPTAPDPSPDHGASAAPSAPGRREVVKQQKERFGGIKWGSAFFGWLTATGTGLLLTAPATATGAVLGLANTPGGAGQAAEQAGQAAQDPATVQTAGLVTAVVVLVILFVAYYCGGYVAGRMARFNGLRQGVAVWLWALLVAAIVATLVGIAGSQFNILANLNSLPRLPVGEGDLTTGGIITALVALAASLGGAILGGLAGMRFHRRVDRAGFDH